MRITVLDVTDSLVSVECYIPKELLEDNVRYTKGDEAINEVLSKLVYKGVRSELEIVRGRTVIELIVTHYEYREKNDDYYVLAEFTMASDDYPMHAALDNISPGAVVLLIGEERLDMYKLIADKYSEGKYYLLGDPFSYADHKYYNRIVKQVLKPQDDVVKIYQTDNKEGIELIANKLYKYVDLDNPPKEGYYIKIFTKFRNHSTGEIEVVDHNLNDFSQTENDVRW